MTHTTLWEQLTPLATSSLGLYFIRSILFGRMKYRLRRKVRHGLAGIIFLILVTVIYWYWLR